MQRKKKQDVKEETVVIPQLVIPGPMKLTKTVHANIPGRGILHVKTVGEERTITLQWFGIDGRQRIYRCTEV